MRNTICLLLATIVFGQSLLEAKAGAWIAARARQEQTQGKPTLKERILEVPPGTMIDVRLLNKTKLRGKLGEITDEGFSLQTAQGNKIEKQQIAFTDVKSIKTHQGKGGHAVWYVLAGVGIVLATLLIIAAAAGAGD